MHLRIYILLVFLSIGLSGCDAIDSVNTDTTPTILNIPNITRQISSIDDSEMRLVIRVNGGAIQTFTVPGGQTSMPIELRNIRLGENNSITVLWIELLNGYDVEMALQTQTFFAEGNVTIDSEYSSQQFDYDQDGQSNFNERISGTCVWSANDLCLLDGNTDVPPETLLQPGIEQDSFEASVFDVQISPAFSQNGTVVPFNTINNATATIVDENFTTGVESWYSDDGEVSENDTMCIVFQRGVMGYQGLLVYSEQLLTFESADYLFQFDLWVNRAAPVSAGLYEERRRISILDHYVQGSNQWTTHTILVESDISSSNMTIGFQAIRSVVPTKYCFDNIKIVKL